jgi:hypothetical protein
LSAEELPERSAHTFVNQQHGVRNVARALAIGAVVALVVDVVFRNALEAAQSPGASSLTPWWAVGRVFERAVWVVLALLLWASAAAVARATREACGSDHGVPRAAAFAVVGRLMIVLPLLWLLATWLVTAFRITVAGDWEIDGYMFRTASYYNSVVLGYVPWAAGGIVLRALRRHAATE